MRWLLGDALGPAGSLEWLASGGQVVLAVVVALAAFALAWSTASRHPVHRRLRLGEAACWAGALLVLVAAAAGPTWVEEEGRVEPGKLVVLVDGSASMGVVEDGEARSEGVAEILEAVDRAGDGRVEVFTFDEDLRSGLPTSYEGRGTDLGVALDAIADRHLGQQLRGIVVVSDGLDRGSLRRAWRDPAADSATRAPSLPGPLSVYQVGRVRDLEDLAILDVVSGGFAFLRTPFRLEAQIRGQPGAAVPVTLSREGSLAGKQTVVLDDEGLGATTFEVMPTKVGRFAWEVSVPTSEDDAVPGNNTFPVVIRVVRDRTRVLQVTGSPSYDQKFLRLFLKEDPSVDLVSFFILRTHDDMGAGWQGRELSLIEFPYTRLFTDELETFDLIIFQNFNYRPYFSMHSDELLRNIARFVEGGGAFVMTGGDRSYDLGDYADTALSRVLPVQLGVVGERVDVARFQPVPNAAGGAHPVTQLSADPEENARLWAQLPPMDGLNLTNGLVEGAATLLEHPRLTVAGGDPMPVLAVREVGAGRTMALGVDSSWRWSFTEAGAGRGNQAYLRFWKNAMRWLVADPEDRRVVVSPSRENVLLGDEVRLVVSVRDAGYGPVAEARVAGQIIDPMGEHHTFEVTTDGSGEGRTAFTPSRRGAHRVSVSVAGPQGDRGESVFAVSARDPELVEIVPDGQFLSELAGSYGDRGAYHAPGDLSAPLVDEAAGRTVEDRRETPLATAPLVAVIFGLLASLGWWMRRRGGAR